MVWHGAEDPRQMIRHMAFITANDHGRYDFQLDHGSKNRYR